MVGYPHVMVSKSPKFIFQIKISSSLMKSFIFLKGGVTNSMKTHKIKVYLMLELLQYWGLHTTLVL